MKNTLVTLSTVVVLAMFGCQNQVSYNDELNLENKLSGFWVATAFDGELHENWELGENGWMNQVAHYIEKKDTSYSASTQIQKINNEILLISVIKNSNPKIFKSVENKGDKIVFENTDYQNPSKVIYEFIDDVNYRRTIIGKENDSLVTYEFNFKKRN